MGSMKNVDIIKVLDKVGVEHRYGGGRWVQICCPWCDDHKFHMGYALDSGAFNCFRCGVHKPVETVAKLGRISTTDAIKLMVSFKTDGRRKSEERLLSKHQGRKLCGDTKLPPGVGPLGAWHRQYLARRRFDPDKLVRQWRLYGTTHLSGKWSFRIIIPVYQDGRLVTFQGRDFTGHSEVRYLSPDADECELSVKECLYGQDQVHGESVVVVEGPTDVWRLGPGAVATFGTEYTDEQLVLLAQYANVKVMFDGGEVAAQESAEALSRSLGMLGSSVELVTLSDGDPGDLADEDADELMRDLLGRGG